MNWQIFISTFLLIFLAELGDKTQLAVMAQSAGSSSRWMVFAAGSLALILSTAVGVLAGGLLRRWMPDVSTIRICGGLMFLLFGVAMLTDVVRKKRKETQSVAISAPDNWMSRHVIQHAMMFEAAAAEKYTELAAREKDVARQALYNWLAEEERAHMKAMKAGLLIADEEHHIQMTSAMVGDLPPRESLLMLAGATGRDYRTELSEAIEGEEAQVKFYEALATHCKIPRLKDTFQMLARAEDIHASKLRAILNGESYERLD
jgi:Ca2+/H+ antiporter, TMEM165/GDT1 family